MPPSDIEARAEFEKWAREYGMLLAHDKADVALTWAAWQAALSNPRASSAVARADAWAIQDKDGAFCDIEWEDSLRLPNLVDRWNANPRMANYGPYRVVPLCLATPSPASPPSGANPPASRESCPSCGGSGTINNDPVDSYYGPVEQLPCPTCGACDRAAKWVSQCDYGEHFNDYERTHRYPSVPCVECRDPFHAERPPVEGLREAFTVAALRRHELIAIEDDYHRRMVEHDHKDLAEAWRAECAAYDAYRASRHAASEGGSK